MILIFKHGRLKSHGNVMNDQFNDQRNWRKFSPIWKTKEIGKATRETYSNSKNTSELFEIEAVLHDLHQGDLSITQYFNTISSLATPRFSNMED